MGNTMNVLFCNRDPRLWNGGDNVQLANTLVSLDARGVNTAFTHFPKHPLNDFDLVHIFHTNFAWSREMANNAHFINKPYILSAIFYPRVIDNSVEQMRDIVNYASAVICLSEAEKEEMIDMLNCKRSHIKVISNGVDKRVYKPSNKKKEGRIIAVGRKSDENKGFKYIELASKKLGLPLHYIDSTDALTAVDMADAYQRSNVFVCPSLSERQSLSVLEAAACGVPIVDSIYNRGSSLLKSSIIVDPKDTDAMCDAIQKQWNKINNDFVPSWDDVAGRIKEVYREVLKN